MGKASGGNSQNFGDVVNGHVHIAKHSERTPIAVPRGAGPPRDGRSSTGAPALSSSSVTGRRVAHGSWSQHQGPAFIGFILLHLSRAEPHVPRHWSLQERLGEHPRHGGAGAGKRPRRNRWRPSD